MRPYQISGFGEQFWVSLDLVIPEHHRNTSGIQLNGNSVLMQSLMGETTPVAHGGNPQDRAASLSIRSTVSKPL